MRTPAETAIESHTAAAAVVVATVYHSLRKGGVREGVSKAVASQDRQVAAHAGDIDDSTRATPAGRQKQQQPGQ